MGWLLLLDWRYECVFEDVCVCVCVFWGKWGYMYMYMQQHTPIYIR